MGDEEGIQWTLKKYVRLSNKLKSPGCRASILHAGIWVFCRPRCLQIPASKQQVLALVGVCAAGNLYRKPATPTE